MQFMGYYYIRLHSVQLNLSLEYSLLKCKHYLFDWMYLEGYCLKQVLRDWLTFYDIHYAL
jgi:hypothetical protein